MSAENRQRTAPVDPLLSIGVFARRSRLSMKALRLYWRNGLLTPADVDADTGYRRYRESQLTTARLIVMLRRLNMPLAQVADTVSAPGAPGRNMRGATRILDRVAPEVWRACRPMMIGCSVAAVRVSTGLRTYR